MGSRVVHSIRAFVTIAALAFAALFVLLAALAPVQAHAIEAQSSKLAAPNFSQANSHVDHVMLSWNLDYDDTGDNPISPDEELIDHFNVYCDGRLVAQIDISAAEESVSLQGGSRSHTWWFAYDPGDRWAVHNFQVSSVAKDGTEGYLSEVLSAEAKGDDLEVVSHQAADYTSSIGLEFKVLGYNSLERFDLWRSQGTTPPDTNAAPYAVISTNRRPEATIWDYWDKDVPADGNYTYTYTVRATDCEGTESNFYTFTVIHSSEGDNPSLNPPYVDYELVNNIAPTLTFTASNWADEGYPTVYKFYRNDVMVDSFAGEGDHSFSDTPTTDGTYTYRVDMEVAGFTVRGREYTFIRDTKPVDLPTKPDAPSLVGRLDSEHMITLAWTPAATGGEVEGYHIYRKDAGAFVEGSYRRSSYFYLWGLNRYLNVSADTTTFVDIGIPGATDAYLGDYSLGKLTEVWWGDADAPHEYYITAYNDYGESAPSNVVTFPYTGGSEPLNGDTAAPGAPTITWAWVEWEDDSNSDSYVEQGIFDENPGYNIRVAWDEPADAATTVSSYRATFDDGGDYVYEDSVPRYGLLNGLHVQDGTSEYSPLRHVYAGDEDDFNKQFAVVMYAVNEAGETASAPVTVQVDGPPRIQVKYDSGAAIVRWADPVYAPATLTVTGWELYKRPEHGLVSKVGEFGPDVYEFTDIDVLDGWTYDYYVVAKTNEGDRRSATASRLISRGDGYGEDVGAPTNLTATVVNGRLVLSWERPANENIYVSFYIAEFKYPGSDEWVTEPYACAYGGYEGMTIDDVSDLVDKDMQVRVHAESTDHSGPNGDGVHAPSEPVSFRITSAQAAAHEEGRPGTVMISGEAGEGWCKIAWSTSTDTNKPPATEYRIKRYDADDGVYGGYATIGTVASKGDGSYDYEYIDHYVENGKTYRYMVYPTNCGTEALVDSNYNYVELSPAAKTHDQQVAEMMAEIIAALPEPADVTVDDIGRIREVEEIWNGLTDDQQKLVKKIDKTLPEKLADDVTAVEDLELLEQYAELVAPVQALIDALPEPADVTLDDKALIEEARAAYDAITPAKAKRIVKTARLTDDESRIAALEKAEADAAAAQVVIDAIAALPPVDDLTEDDADDVAAVREAYDALTADQKALVDDAPEGSNTATLEAAEEQLEKLATPHIRYRTGVEGNTTWQGWKYDGELSGTVGQSLRMEGLKIELEDAPYSGGIRYCSQLQSDGWEGDDFNKDAWPKDGGLSGYDPKKTGGKRLEAVRIELYGEMAEHYDVWYHLQVQRFGWMAWAKNGEPSGTVGYAFRVEALEIVLAPKGSEAPTIGSRVASDQINMLSFVRARSYDNKVWQGAKGEGDVSGTRAQTKTQLRVGLASSSLTAAGVDRGDVYVSVRVYQGGKWSSWSTEDDDYMGSAKGKPITGIQAKLALRKGGSDWGDLDGYDLYYRAEVRESSKACWLGWAKNGQTAGQSNLNLEQLEFSLVPKGEPAPPANADELKDTIAHIKQTWVIQRWPCNYAKPSYRF